MTDREKADAAPPRDARFEEGGEVPVYLGAEDAADLAVISALVQDAVFPVGEISWQRGRRRLALLLNRFRWEQGQRGAGEVPERVRAVLAVRDVLAVRSRGIDRADAGRVLSLLALDFAPGKDGAGVLTLVMAGGGSIALEVEALDVTLKDVTRPYAAPSGRRPEHRD